MKRTSDMLTNLAAGTALLLWATVAAAQTRPSAPAPVPRQ